MEDGIGPSYAPHAPTLRSSYSQKVSDTFDALWGRERHPQTPGIMDYLTLGIGFLFRLLAILLVEARERKFITLIFHPLTYLLQYSFMWVEASIKLFTLFVSIVLTLVVSIDPHFYKNNDLARSCDTILE